MEQDSLKPQIKIKNMLELRDYQDQISSQAAQLLEQYKICYLAMECRTGKTLTALAVALKYGAKSVLVISKLKALPSIYSDYNQMRPDFALDAINYESAHKCAGNKYDLVILDEAHSLGAFPKPSKRTKMVKALCKGLPIIYLSGTPTPESFSQLYHQFWVSSFSPFKLFANFYKWAKVYVNTSQKMVAGHTINDYSNARKDKIDEVTKKLFIDFSQEEAGFDAKIEEYSLSVPMSEWTQYAINRLKRDRVLSWDDVNVLGDTPVKLMTKLHQLSSGSVIDESGTHIITDYSKAKYIRDYFAGQKIAIFYVYQTEAELLKKAFPKWTDVPEVFQQSDDNDMVYLGQVRSAREGVRLDSAEALIFYNLEYSYLSYEQGKNRLSSKERTTPAKVYFVCSDCGIEQDILEAVHGKTDYTYSYYKSKQNGKIQF